MENTERSDKDGGAVGEATAPAAPKPLYKLYVHAASFSTEDLIIRSEDFPDVQVGDILEIYHEEDTFSRLLLQVHPESLVSESNMTKNSPKKNTVFIDKVIADSFCLTNFKGVIINKVDPAIVSLDSVELTFKDQYLGRSEMWRLKKSMVNSVVYLNKKVCFCKGSIRCTINEMWGQGDRVACGLVTTDTKVVFRSTTAMVYLFIQMSSEMWDFDIHGDLYFEKAVNGFLYEMFSKWKEKESAHEVTIVLFSRTFYDAQDLCEFPEHMKECLQQDHGGRFYEDFYRVAVQNERFEDWFPTLTLLRQSFTRYKDHVLDYHTRPGIHIPKATNSTAAQGNFLEVLNISLNTFENSHINRNLDRTGQQAIVITPGVGIFEVDRDLTIITKQRIIDSGVGSDLICVGEQPLHAVPLFKMHTKGRNHKHSHDFSMPHWINLSFYTTNKKVGYSTFIPRIKLPPLKDTIPSGNNGLGSKNTISGVMTCFFPDSVAESVLPDSPFAYDEYDAKIFQLPVPSSHGKGGTAGASHRIVSRQKSKNSVISVGSTDSPVKKLGPFKVSDSYTPSGIKHSTPSKLSSKNVDDNRRINWHVGSQEDSFFKDDNGFNRGRKASSAIFIPSTRGRVTLDESDKKDYYSKSFGGKFNTTEENTGMSLGNNFRGYEEKNEDAVEIPDKPIFGSAGSHFDHSNIKNMLLRPGKALVNPFDPSQVTEKLTSNRRRWTHIFPKIPACNHQNTVGHNDSSSYTPPPPDSTHSTITTPARAGDTLASSLLKRISDVSASTIGGASERFASQDKLASRCPRNRSISNCELKLGNFMWGATAEQSWDATTATGVDWKSIIFPASLPITTDFIPELRSLQNDYVVNDYDLVPDDVNADYVSHSPLQKPPLTTREVFLELISQRLAHGFQLIILPKDDNGHDLGVLSPGAIVPSVMNTSFIQNQKISLVKPLLKQVHVEEFWLSIGRIFHHITLTGSVIKVMIYRPRHPYPSLDYHYRYRFMAPDNDTYDISWVEFNMEKLENYNWNYLDNYVCTRGDQDFAMTEGQKYWRFRMYALPLNPFVQMTKKLMEGPLAMRCDIYENPGPEDEVNLVAGFLKFVETCMNKIRRPVSACTNDNAYRQRKTQRSHTMVTGELKPPGPMARSMFRERLGSNKGMERGRDRTVSGPPIKAVERSRTESGSNRDGGEPLKPLAQSTLETSGSQDSVFGASGSTSRPTSLDNNQEHKDFKLLRSTCTLAEIQEAMKNPNTGLTFVSKQTVLPSTTFVSAEGVLWLMEHVEGIHSEAKAINLMDEMLSKNMIRHASGDPRQKFVYGFYLFFLLSSAEKEQPITSLYGGDLESFQNDWIEVELKFIRTMEDKDDELDNRFGVAGHDADFLEYNLRRFSGNEHVVNRKKGRLPFRHFTVDVDPSPSTKSERPEWGSGKYQVSFRPDQAFEMVLKWTVATGALVSELISNWSRKSQQNGLSIIPIPCDPFALPSQNSDPIRGPIFVELDTECLMEEKSHLFEEFPEETREQRLFLFRESILRRFGFVACSTDPNHQKSSATFSTQHQYIHSTGNMFVLIPTRLQLQAGILGMKSLKKRSLARAEGSPGESPKSRHSPSEASSTSSRQPGSDVITRNVTGNTRVTYEHHETGFLWAWNFMISKRWKTQSTTGATGDIPFMDKMLADFRRFCRNEDNRLKQYWLDCWTRSSSNQDKFF